MQRTDFTAMSRLSADIDLMAEGKATGFVRVPHSVHRSAYGWIPIPIVRIKNGDGPNVLMQAGKTRTLSGPGTFGASGTIQASQSMGGTVTRMLAKGPTMQRSPQRKPVP